MKRLLLIAAIAVALPGGCVSETYRPAVEFPVIRDLPAEVLKDCPPADAVTGELGDLASKDATLAIEYARCRARLSTAVGAYLAVQALMRDAATKANAPPQAASGR